MPEFRDVVTKVIASTLDLMDRVEMGTAPDLETERGRLIELLPANIGAAELQADYAGDGRTFLGARYALACWIDELFIVHSAWAERWKPLVLEYALFGTRLRAERFWEQADIVLRRPSAPRPLSPPGPNALEAYFLCILLGFRGTHRDDPGKVRGYVDEMRPQVARVADWPAPGDRGVKTDVEPLVGGETLRKIVAGYGVALLVVVLLLMVVLRVVT
jgi:type VI secretion system protein ImpK